MAHVAERQETVIECFGAFKVKETYTAEQMPATQRKTLGVIKSEGGRAECWTKGSRQGTCDGASPKR